MQTTIELLQKSIQQNLQKNVEKKKRELVVKELSLVKQDYGKVSNSIAIKQLDFFSEIESNFSWIHYIYQRIFYEISLINGDNVVSFRDLRKVLKSIKKRLEAETQITNESCFILTKNNDIIKTNQQNFLIPTCFHTRDEKILVLRKALFTSLNSILIDNILQLQYMEFREILAKNITKIAENCIVEQHQLLRSLMSNFLSMLSYFCARRNFPFIVNCFENVY